MFIKLTCLRQACQFWTQKLVRRGTV